MALRAGMVVLPLCGSVAAMAILSRALPTPTATSGDFPRLVWWAAVLIGSLVAMWCVDRLTRRLAPLVALLDMAVLFPGRAPSRMKVARRAGDLRNLETVSRRARDTDRPVDLADAAVHILSLVGALRAHDRHTRGHSERVRVYTDLIALQMKLPSAAVDRLRWAALLHDIGKLRVPTATLNKPAKLSLGEWEVVRQHPIEGARIAAALLPWLGEWGQAIAEHHERFDGSGYPKGLQGKDISISGRIVAVADAFEVMTAPRTYKKAMTRSAALAELVRFSGSQFDPDVVRALLQVSAPRLRWAMGPTSWLVGTPMLGAAPSLTAATVAAQATVGVTAVAVAGVTGLAAPVAAAPPSGPSSPSATPAAAVATPAPGKATATSKPVAGKSGNPTTNPGSATSVPVNTPASGTASGPSGTPTHPAPPNQAAQPSHPTNGANPTTPPKTSSPSKSAKAGNPSRSAASTTGHANTLLPAQPSHNDNSGSGSSGSSGAANSGSNGSDTGSGTNSMGAATSASAPQLTAASSSGSSGQRKP